MSVPGVAREKQLKKKLLRDEDDFFLRISRRSPQRCAPKRQHLGTSLIRGSPGLASHFYRAVDLNWEAPCVTRAVIVTRAATLFGLRTRRPAIDAASRGASSCFQFISIAQHAR